MRVDWSVEQTPKALFTCGLFCYFGMFFWHVRRILHYWDIIKLTCYFIWKIYVFWYSWYSELSIFLLMLCYNRVTLVSISRIWEFLCLPGCLVIYLNLQTLRICRSDERLYKVWTWKSKSLLVSRDFKHTH